MREIILFVVILALSACGREGTPKSFATNDAETINDIFDIELDDETGESSLVEVSTP